MSVVALVIGVLLAGCTGAEEASNRGAERASASPAAPTVDDLGPFEEELVGTWSRFHDYDDSMQYYIFNADRTGMKYEVASNGSTTDEYEITFWALEDDGDDVYRIRLAGPGISSEPQGYLSADEFHYLDDEIRLGGYDNLTMTRD